MLLYLDQGMQNFRGGNIRQTVIDSAKTRLRPVLMTALTDMIALLPLFWGDEPGNVAMRRIAMPMVGGSITALMVTLVLIPMIYEWWYLRIAKKH